MRWAQDRRQMWKQIFRENGYAQVHTVPDLTGIGRVVLGQKAEI